MIETMYLRDHSSGKVHVAFRKDGVLYTAEGCNRDSAGSYDVVTLAEMLDMDPDNLCERDFPGSRIPTEETA